MPIIRLTPNDHVDLVIGGQMVRVTATVDDDGNPLMQLAGVDCNLAGEEPGAYYLEPIDDDGRERLQRAVDAEVTRLDATDATPPLGGWRYRAVEAVALDYAMNPYRLDRLLRGVSA